ncbi:MAG: aminotransferase class IV [Candidatus Acidiferrales bacterium]
MIHRFVFHNDRLLPVAEVRLSPGQAGLLNGWGLFTTVRIYEGIPFALDRHWQRLQRDAERTHCPFPFQESVVRGQLAEVLRANHVREGAARIYMIYNQVGFWRSDENFPRVDLLLCSADLPSYREPARLGLREHGRHAASPLAGVKVLSWLDNVWNYYEAQQAGFDEVVLLNERGEVAECTAANIFCVKDGSVATPPLTAGCLQGITRGVLLEIGASVGAPATERTLLPDDLYAADEVFITSTNRSMLGVSEINDHKIASAPGPVTLKLEKAFGAYVRQYLEMHSAASGHR